jgi:hypothetical protein
MNCGQLLEKVSKSTLLGIAVLDELRIACRKGLPVDYARKNQFWRNFI